MLHDFSLAYHNLASEAAVNGARRFGLASEAPVHLILALTHV